MFSLRRCCFGAALGLGLLACAPAYAQNYLPLHNPSFKVTTNTKGTGTLHNPYGVTGWFVSTTTHRQNGFLKPGSVSFASSRSCGRGGRGTPHEPLPGRACGRRPSSGRP